MTNFNISDEIISKDKMQQLMPSFIKGGYQRDAQLVDAFKGINDNGMINIDTPGAMNMKYGPQIIMLPYMQRNALAVFGQTGPFQAGRRMQTQLSMGAGDTAGVPYINENPKPAYGAYAQVLEMPKEFQMVRAMPFVSTFLASSPQADMVEWDQFIESETATFVRSQDFDVLRRIEDAPLTATGTNTIGGSTTTQTYRVGYEAFERICSNAKEASFLPDTYAIPWYLGGIENGSPNNSLVMSGSYTDLATVRGQGVYASEGTKYGTEAAPSFYFDSYVDANYTDSKTDGTATLRAFSLDMLDKMIFATAPYANVNNAVADGACLLTGFDTLQKISALAQDGGVQKLLNTEFASVSVNGVQSMPGRQGGLTLNNYLGYNIIPDMFASKGTVADKTAGISRIYRTDPGSCFISPLVQPNVQMSDNPLITNGLNKRFTVYSAGELQATKFKSLGKIVHIQ